ncbi:MAG: DUF512 domain-containing protein [Coprococcus sp.]|nr:DUF512 domain-containing protein [Coprococcus sp.]
MNHEHIVDKVEEGSIAWEVEIRPGDVLLCISGHVIEDVFDYQYYTNDEELTLLIRKPDGEEWEIEIEKEYDEDLGLVFKEGLMDEYRSCRNKCMFCFIDQMPKGMRETLYFKDDDSRLSFLQGNYVTLTNMSDHDIRRIIEYHLEPINVSIHTTNPELRCTMLHNRFAGEALDKIQTLYDGGITMNGQIVLCRGINDGDELTRTIRDMEKWVPSLQSVSVVPVGLTKYREGLYPLEPFAKEDAKGVLAEIHRWQDYFFEKYGIHFIHAGDEWYILAEEEIPEAERYDGYLQLENGVGMLRLLLDEFDAANEERLGDDREVRVSLATAKLAYPYLERMLERLKEKYPNLKAQLYEIRNDFFGERITVAGLLTGQDLAAQLKGKELGDVLLIPCNMLRSGEEVFLDDVTVEELSRILEVRIQIVGSGGGDFIEAVLQQTEESNYE